MKLMNRLNENDGWITILVICTLSVLLPIFLFFYVDINQYEQYKNRLSDVTQNMASSAVRSINESALLSNEVVINGVEAQTISKELFIQNFHLDSDLSITPSSGLRNDPTVNVYVENQVGKKVTLPEGFSYQIQHPTVIVYTEIEPKSVFINRLVKIKDIKAYEVQISEEALARIESSKEKRLLLENELNELKEQGEEEVIDSDKEELINNLLEEEKLRIEDLEFHMVNFQ